MIIILDVDNCIAHDEWRRHLIDERAQHPDARYHDYHLASAFDECALEWRRFSSPSTVLIFTAMPELYRKLRELWLNKNGIGYAALMMRRHSDHRSSVAVKRDMLQEAMALYRAVPHEIRAYDDRDDVIAMYQEQGVDAVLYRLGKEHV